MPQPNASRDYVRRLCLDVLQRTPSPAEVRTYTGAPLDMVAARVVGSLEAMQQWLEEQLEYFLLLDNFRPETRSVQAIPERVCAGRMSARDAIAEIVLSTGFGLRNPGNDTFVTVVLEQCLGLRVQDRAVKPVLEAGKRMYDGEKTKLLGAVGASQSDLVRIVLAQPEFTRHLLDRHHRRLLQEPLAGDGKRDHAREQRVRDVVARVHEAPGAFFAVLQEWLTSQPYHDAVAERRPKSHRQFVRALYHDLLARTPSERELRDARNALLSMADPAPVRSILAKVILDSGKAELPVLDKDAAEAFVGQCFVRYLGREPSGEELQRFAEVARDPDARAGHVVRSLVTSVEYHYY